MSYFRFKLQIQIIVCIEYSRVNEKQNETSAFCIFTKGKNKCLF